MTGEKYVLKRSGRKFRVIDHRRSRCKGCILWSTPYTYKFRVGGSLVTTARRVLRLWMEETASRYGG
jgi:hypothetical protein